MDQIPHRHTDSLGSLGNPDLTGYGYHRSDNDGYDGGYVTPQEHKEEELIEAAKQRLDAKEKTEN